MQLGGSKCLGLLIKESGHYLHQLMRCVHVYVVAGFIDYLQLGVWQLFRDLIDQLDADEAVVPAPYHKHGCVKLVRSSPPGAT